MGNNNIVLSDVVLFVFVTFLEWVRREGKGGGGGGELAGPIRAAHFVETSGCAFIHFSGRLSRYFIKTFFRSSPLLQL